MTRRKSAASYNKEICAFCQENKKDNAPHEVRSESMGARIKYVAKNSSDQSLKIRLANLIASEDAKAGVAFDIKYHLPCLISAERSAEPSISQQSQPESDLSLLLSDMEIVEILELELNDSTGKILNMNDINATYINLLEENGVKNLRSDYKKHLTNLIQENIPNVHFNRPDNRAKPMQVLSLQTKEKVISKATASPKLVE